MLLDDLLGHYRELLYLPDETAVLAALATVAAQDIPGPPVWTMLVGPPSSGKTEIIDSLRLVDRAVSLSALTRASLLSGRAGGAGGLLLTHFSNGSGLLLVKDFTTILSEAAGTRTEIIAVLRDPRSREIELTPEPESPARLAGELHQLQQGLLSIGGDRQQAQTVLRAAALGSIPKQRRLTLFTLLNSPQPLRPTQIAARTQTPEASIRRPLEDLAALGIIECHHLHQGWWGNQLCTPTAAARQQWFLIAA